MMKLSTAARCCIRTMLRGSVRALVVAVTLPSKSGNGRSLEPRGALQTDPKRR